jgi:hypothetical protein
LEAPTLKNFHIQVPAPVTDFEKQFPDGKSVTWELENGNYSQFQKSGMEMALN